MWLSHSQSCALPLGHVHHIAQYSVDVIYTRLIKQQYPCLLWMCRTAFLPLVLCCRQLPPLVKRHDSMSSAIKRDVMNSRFHVSRFGCYSYIPGRGSGGGGFECWAESIKHVSLIPHVLLQYLIYDRSVTCGSTRAWEHFIRHQWPACHKVWQGVNNDITETKSR